MMRFKVAPSAKFSYSIARGDVHSRLQKGQDLNNIIYSKLKEQFISSQKPYILLPELKSIIASIFPEQKIFSLVKINKKDLKQMEASADYIFDSFDNIIGHIVEVPAKRNKFAMMDVPTLMHEMTHVFDKMFNPKIMKRTAVLSSRYEYNPKFDIEIDKYNRLTDKMYGKDYEKFSTEAEKVNVLETRKQDLLNFLRGKSAEEKLDIIQNLRYHLQLELNAYTVENGYIDRMTPKGENFSNLKCDTDKFLFKEKIKMLKEVGFEIIKRERAKIHKSVNKVKNQICS